MKGLQEIIKINTDATTKHYLKTLYPDSLTVEQEEFDYGLFRISTGRAGYPDLHWVLAGESNGINHRVKY